MATPCVETLAQLLRVIRKEWSTVDGRINEEERTKDRKVTRIEFG
jgi:hypothetical protein